MFAQSIFRWRNEKNRRPARRRIRSGKIKSPRAVFQSRRRWIFGVGERRRTAESGGQKNAEEWTHK